MDVIDAWRNSGLGKRCTCTSCFYCDRQLDVHQHDHYPIPKRAGGTEVVATCLVCHDLKDRIPLKHWDLKAMHEAFDELFREEVKTVRSMPWPQALDCFYDYLPEVEGRWSELSPLARVLLAKIRCVHEDTIFLNSVESRTSLT